MKDLQKHIGFAKAAIAAFVGFSSYVESTASKKMSSLANHERLDITKYYITGEGVLNDEQPSSYVFQFKPENKIVFSTDGGFTSFEYTYAYQKGVLLITGNPPIAFTIQGKQIINTTVPDEYKSYFLQKIPEVDAFIGKSFEGSILTNKKDKDLTCSISFRDGIFSQSFYRNGKVIKTVTEKKYSLLNNGVATLKTGNNESQLLLTIVEDNNKLYYSEYNFDNDTQYYGVLTLSNFSLTRP